MSSRLSRFGLAALLALTLFTGLLFGSVFSTAPLQVRSQEVVDEQTVLLQKLYRQVNPSVVNLLVTFPLGAEPNQLVPLPFPTPRRGDGQEREFVQAEGSGFVYDANGHIVTNAHVVNAATRIQVTFSDGTVASAEKVGVDPDSDIAVIKVDAEKVKGAPLPLADISTIEVGERAIAIGNPFGQPGTMTHGIVSGIGRLLESQRAISSDGTRYLIPQVLQTDAPINPGNSGGPLLNIKGEVIGVNTAIESRLGQSSGVGFAVPSSVIKKVADKLIKDGKIEHSYLGIVGSTLLLEHNQLMKLDDNFKGVLVAEIALASPAAKAGIKRSTKEEEIEGITYAYGGDIIVGIDDQKVDRFEDLLGYLFVNTEPGQTVTVKVYRNGEVVELPVTLEARPVEE
jgi:2-alkenal reductase